MTGTTESTPNTSHRRRSRAPGADPAGADLGVGQDRPARAGPRAGRGRAWRWCPPATRRGRSPRRAPGRLGGERHRVRRGARGPGQDPAPVHPRRTARRSPQTRARRAARASSASSRSTWSWSTCIRSSRPCASGAAPDDGDRTDRHRRPGHGARRRRRTTRRWRSWSTRRPTRRCWTAVAAGGFTLAQRQALATHGLPAHRRLRRAGGQLAEQSWWPIRPRTSAAAPAASPFPEWIGATWQRARCSATARTRTRRRRCTARAGRHRPASRRRAAARQGDVVQQLRRRRTPPGGPPTTTDGPTVAIIKHANPCGIAVGARRRRRHTARRTPATRCSAFGGVIACNRAVTAEMAEQVAEIFTEVLLAPAFDDAALAVLTRKKNIRLLAGARACRTGAWRSGAISGGLLVQSVDTIDAPGDDPARLDAGGRANRRRRRCWPTCPSPGGPAER